MNLIVPTSDKDLVIPLTFIVRLRKSDDHLGDRKRRSPKTCTDGEQPNDFDGYEIVQTLGDKDGNITHIYRKVEKPVKKVTTIWVTEKGEVLKSRTDGEQPKT